MEGSRHSGPKAIGMQKVRRSRERKALCTTALLSELKLRPARLRESAWVQREDSCGAISLGASRRKCREAEIAEEVT